MRIAHIAPPWIAVPPANYGGTEMILYNLVEEQVAQGHDVTLLAPGDARTSARVVSFFQESLKESGTPWGSHLKAFYHLWKSMEYVREHEFDIVHTHLSSAADMYIFPLAASLGKPHVTTLHSRFPFDRVDDWIGDADHLYMEWALSVPVVAISQSARDEVPYPLNFVGVVHHGLPMHDYVPTMQRPEGYFAWLGRITPDKGPHLAIQAAREAGVPLVLAGTVDQNMSEAVRYFEEQIEPHIDGESVRYIGPANLPQKVELLSRARGFLNPIMWEEPFGIVMIEAMAVGCPVISFARGASTEIVVHNKSGFLVHSASEMARHIAKIDELDRAVIRAYAEKEFSICSMAEKYTRVYRQVIAVRQRVPARGRSVDWARAGIIPIPTPNAGPLVQTANDAGASGAAQSGGR